MPEKHDRLEKTGVPMIDAIRFRGSATGRQIVSLMRSNRVTIRELSRRMGFTQKHVRSVRDRGLNSAGAIRDWVEAITGEDPGLM